MRYLLTAILSALVLLTIMSALVPFTHSGFIPYLQILPSFDHLLWVSAVVVAIIAILLKYKPFLPVINLLLITCLILWRSHDSTRVIEKPVEQELTVLCLNVGQFANDTAVVEETIERIKELDPDIVCLQEFGLYYKWPSVQAVAEDFSNRIHRDHYDFSPYPGNIFGTAIFSKFPIIEKDTIFSMLSATNEAKAYVLDIGDDELRLVNMHLQSYNLFGRHRGEHSMEDDLIETLSRRKSQVGVIRRQKADVVVGDMNSSAGSYYYEMIAGKWNDVQLACGKGLLPTHAVLPTRLDYVFTRRNIQPISLDRVTDFPSDHYGLLATIGI